jgi:hypothetical protein
MSDAKQEFPLVKYDAMLLAIAECEVVDEAKDIKDKAFALETYFRIARQNPEAEQRAHNVRLRAEKRIGELMKEMERDERSKGGDVKSAPRSAEPIKPSEYAATRERLGITTQDASTFQQLADMPKEEFEAALASPEKLSARQIVERSKASNNPPAHLRPDPIDPDRLYLWGALLDFEKRGFLNPESVNHIWNGAEEWVCADFARLVPLTIKFLQMMEKDRE